MCNYESWHGLNDIKLLFIFFFLSLFCRQALIYKYNMTDLEVQKKSEKKFFVYIFF